MSSDLGSPLQGTVLIVDVEVGDQITEGQRVVLLESMKMEHEVLAPSGGVVTRVLNVYAVGSFVILPFVLRI